MKRVVFLRDFQAFRGGHLKVFHYFQHVCGSSRYEARVRFTEDSVWGPANPWWEHPEARLQAGEALDADVIVLAARSDWLALAPEQRADSPVPIINLIQGFRHIRPGEAASQFLSNRAIRVCVTPELEQALRSDGSASGPLFTIPIGLDLEILPAERPPEQRDLDCVIVAVKDRPLGRSLARRLKAARRRVLLIDRPLARTELLEAFARAKVSVHLPAADEGAYLPALESMALGTLVVCPDCVGNRSFCRDGETCAVPEREEASLLAATERLLELSPGTAEAMRLAGHARSRRTRSRPSGQASWRSWTAPGNCGASRRSSIRAQASPPAPEGLPHVLHIATVHYRSPRWIEIQTRHLRRHVPVPYRTWTSLEGIDPSYGSHFDQVLEQQGTHAAKLNHLATEICHVAGAEDLLMFLDGDAFTIADPMPVIEAALARAALLAVRRDENAEEPQPHPSFCVTTVGAWRSLCGDWTAGPTWTGAHGSPTSDVGANLLRKLELTKTPWVPLLRSNGLAIDPLYFGVYGDIVYHHGAGFRSGELSPAHRERAPAVAGGSGARGPLGRLVGGLRWRRWERSERARLARESQRIFEAIERDDGETWLRELGES